MRPTSPYGCAKAFATQLCRVYRQSYGMFVCNGILYNHESPRRGENFVTRKIARSAARISRGLDVDLVLGNLESERDWGRAQDYVVAMWMMLQHDKPDDFVVATGETHSVRDFVCAVARELGSAIRWQGSGSREEGFDAKTGARIVAIDPRYFRPSEVDTLLGDATRAREKMGWKPRTSFDELVAEMVREEREIARVEASGKQPQLASPTNSTL